MNNIDEKRKAESEIVKKRILDIWKDKRSFKKRLIIAGAAMLAACFTFIFFGPLELVAFSGKSLLYSYRDVIWLLFISFVIIWGISTVLISLLRGKIFNYVVCTIFAFTLSGYIQSMLLNGSLGTLTGDAINWHNLKTEMYLGIVLWTVILISLYTVMYLHKRIWANIIKFVSLFLVVIQLVPLFGIVLGIYDTGVGDLGNSNLTTQGMYNYSQNNNTFVFVLDRLDFDYVEEVMKNDPDFFNKLDGFTAYNNAISSTARTKPALNQLLTGCEDIAYKVSTKEFFKNSWFEDGKDILRDISAQGYSIELYTEASTLFSDKDYMEKYVQNASSGYNSINYTTAFSKLMNLSAFRYTPIFLKPFFWEDTNYYNKDVLNSKNATPYSSDDVLYMSGLKNCDACIEKNTFKFYHFNGPHAPYNIDKDGNYSSQSTSAAEQLMGCMNHLYNAFDKMKELGIYDSATIIITADHGAPVYDDKPLLKATRIGLFYKPPGSANEPLKWSTAPVCTDNIPATILKSTGADYSLYGKALDEISEGDDITRIYYKSVTKEGGSSNEIKVYKYEVTGDASVFENWKIVDEIDIEHKFY